MGSNDDMGPLTTEGYVCPAKGARLELRPVTLPPLRPTQVEVDMIMVGLCHTDIHVRDNDWGTSDYPIVLGHEGVGVVRRMGSEVSTHEIGDRVALSWIRDSCGECQPCLKGRENICPKGYQGLYLGKSSGCWGDSDLKYNEHGGCFVRVQRIEAKFAIKIPDAVSSEMSAPLLCGGGTVYEPLVNYAEKGSLVGVSSIGGLGTAAIKLATLRGCNVVAISGSAKKKEGALGAGAQKFVDVNDKQAVKAIASTLDMIIDTSPVNADVAPFLDMLKIDGKYVRVGLPCTTDQTFSYQYIPLIFQQKSIVGSVVTGSKRTADMLALVAEHTDFMHDKVHWTTEHLPMNQVNEAMDALQNRTNKGYRFVLEW